ncbi:MAG: type II secretion system protein [Candidatus Shapirobacteria bacterium]
MSNGRKIKNKLAFTLIELLVVIGIISMLTTVVFVSVDPAKRFADARNARRLTDTRTVLEAIQQFVVDSNGSLPAGIGNSWYQIGTCTTGGMNLCVGATTRCIDIGATLGSHKYIKSNPMDPQRGTAATTGYAVTKDANNVFTVSACLAEGTTITVSR